jgi:hypothetical protein
MVPVVTRLDGPSPGRVPRAIVAVGVGFLVLLLVALPGLSVASFAHPAHADFFVRSGE